MPRHAKSEDEIKWCAHVFRQLLLLHFNCECSCLSLEWSGVDRFLSTDWELRLVARFELPAMAIFHTANAWQEGPDIVKLAACTFDEVGSVLLNV